MSSSRSGRSTSAASSSILLDTNIPENVLPQDRDITDPLYGGDIDTRIRQEIVLGIGGMRALEGHGSQAHGLPHERRPLGVPGAGAHPPVYARRQADLRRGAGSRARQQRLHHPHAGARRHRSVRPGPDVPLLRRLLHRGRNRFSSSSWRWAAAIRYNRDERSPWPFWRSRRRRSATP